MINPSLNGSNPAAAKARAIQRDLEARKAARDYDAHCRACGMSMAEANLLAPALVKKGQTLRAVEARQRRQQEIKAKREQMDRRFGQGNRFLAEGPWSQ